MKFLKGKEIKNSSKEDLVKHIKTLADMLSKEEGVDSVELDDCQDLHGKDIIYNGTVIGIDSVTSTGLNYNDMKGVVIGTMTFDEALTLDIKLLIEVVGNYQGTIVNEVL